MRVVAVADTHLFHNDLRVPDGDVFIHAGDLCRSGDIDELAEAARWLAGLPHPTKVVVAGNHDWAFLSTPTEARRLLGPTVHYLQDTGVVLEGLRFWGSPWQPAYNDWAFNLARGPALREKWALIPADTDVLITHGPPDGVGDGSTSSGDGYGGLHRRGCEELHARVLELQPLVHLFGHIHDDGGLWSVNKTTFVNVTTWECERQPTVFDIDVLRRQVTPVHVPPAR
jgi:hypothetical protein